MEVFYALLVSSGDFTFLPELYDIFGREVTIRFLEIFAGCRIRVPKLDKLEALARSTAIYVRLEQVSVRQRQMVIKTLAEEYELTEDRVRTLYAKTKAKLEQELGFKVITRGNHHVKR